MTQATGVFRTIIFFAVLSMLGGCSSLPQEGSVPSAAWKDQMQEMGDTLVNLYPYLVSDKEFNKVGNRRVIEDYAGKLARLAHNVNKERSEAKVKNIDKDPFVSVLSTTLDREINLAVDGLRSGKRDFARAVLKNATSMCVRCHSRGQWGPEFVDWEKNTAFQKLGFLEKGELLAAVRRYDQAIDQYKVILSNKKLAANEAYEWVKAGNSALNVAVRAKQDPKASSEIVNTILTNPSVPAYQRTSALDWKKAIAEWNRDLAKKSKDSLLVQAQKVLKKARGQEDYWGDRSSYIQYLRASALLHDFLRVEASADEQAMALYLLGQCYEVIGEMGGGDANELYYKACVQRAPHTKVAISCYERLEQNIYLDHSGRGDFQFPAAAMDHLRVLRELATPVDGKPNMSGKGLFDSQ